MRVLLWYWNPCIIDIAHWRRKTKRRQKPLPDEVLIPVLTSLIAERKGFDYFDCTWFLHRTFYTFDSLSSWHFIACWSFSDLRRSPHTSCMPNLFSFWGRAPEQIDINRIATRLPPQSHYALGKSVHPNPLFVTRELEELSTYDVCNYLNFKATTIASSTYQ